MSNQRELGIDDKQRAAIVKEVQALQGKVVEIQWQMQAAVEELKKLLDEPRVDEARAVAQADKVMGFEREVKRAHLGALIRIRNLLTDAQRAKLVALRAAQTGR
jgi:Spy/CpxP family protein refolding chaperone